MDKLNAEVEKAVEIIKAGKIILYPTDTIWGIGCDATNAVAIKKIYELKKREEQKSLIILVDSAEMIQEYVCLPSQTLLSYLKEQERPTTCIFERAIHLPATLVNADGTIAIRVVDDSFCKNLISKLKKPLVSTSANISGEAFPRNFLKVSNEIKNGVDYIVQHRQEDTSKSLPSSIIKLNELGEVEKLR